MVSERLVTKTIRNSTSAEQIEAPYAEQTKVSLAQTIATEAAAVLVCCLYHSFDSTEQFVEHTKAALVD